MLHPQQGFLQRNMNVQTRSDSNSLLVDNNSTTRVHIFVNSQTKSRFFNSASPIPGLLLGAQCLAVCSLTEGMTPGAPASASACLPTVRPDWPARGVPPASLWEECCFQVFLHHLSRIALLFSEPVTPCNLSSPQLHVYYMCTYIFCFCFPCLGGIFKEGEEIHIPRFQII